MQQKSELHFSVDYEYKSENRWRKIFESVTSNFVLPFWIKVKLNQNPSGQKAKQQISFQVLDTRYFRYQADSGFNLLYHDSQQLRQYLSYENNSELDNKALNKSDTESLKQTTELYYLWEYTKMVFDQLIKPKDSKLEKDNPNVTEVGLFQKTVKSSNKKQKYLLIIERKPSQITQGQQAVIHETDRIISLKGCSDYLIIMKDLIEYEKRKRLTEDGNQEAQKNKLTSIKSLSFGTWQNYLNFIQKLVQDLPKYQNLQDFRKHASSKLFSLIWKTIQHQKLYQIDIEFKSKISNLKQKEKVKKSLPDQKFIKLLTICFKLTEKRTNGGFFQNQVAQGLSVKDFFEYSYTEINESKNKNQIDFPFKEFVQKRQKRTFSKHYSLAFQGGGAKGLAYVGAYRALKEIKDKNKQIPVKSIMGSSAGGIIALAVSTGIPDSELQKVCYKMKMIPSTDRFVTPDQNTINKDPDDPFVPRDLYGLEITLKDFKQSLKDLLDQYGLLSQDISDKIGKFLQTSEFEVVQQKLIRCLQAEFPTIGQILKYEEEPKQLPEKSFLQKALYGNNSQKESKKIKINWEGLLLHGALMKGQAIHDIAAECLLKFFLKQELKLDVFSKKKLLRNKLIDGFYHSRNAKDEKGNIAQDIFDHIQKHKTLTANLLDLKIKEIYEFYPQKCKEILITIVNRFLILINSHFNQQQQNNQTQKKFLIAKDINIKPLVELRIINKQSKETFLQYLIQSVQSRINESQAFKERKQIIQPLKKMLEKIQNYNSFNSVLNQVNLIKPLRDQKDQKVKQSIKKEKQSLKNSKLHLKDLLKEIFHANFDKVSLQHFFQQQDKHKQQLQITYKDIKGYFLALQGAEAISQVIDFFYDKAFKQQKKQLQKPQKIVDYQKNYNKFLQQMKKITLRQYYTLTGIEMTCTSVDLDDGILRFFNHKTTPYLPVCRSVQMTGSFPVGFKAQRWKQEWGYYNVYLSRRRIQIDLTQHQFTDGGLLANFPIKYLDNADIRRKYFAHEFVDNKTLLFGFGLDFLDESKYVPTEPQLRQILKQRDEAQIAWQDLTTYLDRWFAIKIPLFFKIGLPLVFGKSEKEVEWSKIYHKIIERIPLLRFIVKIAFAYPNADRNLNLQVFQNRVVVHQLEKPFSMKQFEDQLQQQAEQNQKQKIQKPLTRQQCLDRGHIIQFEKFYGKYISRAEKVVEDLAKNPSFKLQTASNDQKAKIDFDKLKNLFQSRQTETKLKYEKIGQQLKKMITADPVNLGDHERSQDSVAKNASQLLIEILLYNLRHSNNVQAVKKFNQQYAYYKFLIQESDSRGLSEYRKDLNKKNFKELYKHDQFQQISRHLSFQQFKENHYEELVKKEQQFIKTKRGWTQSFGIAQLISQYPERQRQLRNLGYAQRAQINKKLKTQEFQQKLKDAQNADSDFSCMSLYDVTHGTKRLTQFLFLAIKIEKLLNKAKDKQTQKHQTNDKLKKVIKRIIQVVKHNNFEKLLDRSITDKINPKNYKQEQKIQQLTYFQIIEFIKNNSHGKGIEIKRLQPEFEKFIQAYQNPKQTKQKDNPAQKIYKLYMIKSFKIDQNAGKTKRKEAEQNRQSQNKNSNISQVRTRVDLQKHQLKDLYMYRLKTLLLSLGNHEILTHHADYFKVLKDKENLVSEMSQNQQKSFFELIYSSAPASQLIMKQTQDERSKRYNNQKSQRKTYPISNEEAERLEQEKVKVQHALFNVLVKNKKNRRKGEGYYTEYLKRKQQLLLQIRRSKSEILKDQKFRDKIFLNQTALKDIYQPNKINITQVEEFLLKMLKVDAIQFLVKDKIEKKGEIEQKNKIEQLKQVVQKIIKPSQKQSTCQNELQKLHCVLCSDMQTLTVIIKQTMLLIQYLTEKKLNLSIQTTQALKRLGDIKSDTVILIYKDIYQQHMKNYAKFSKLSITQIDQLKLNEAFIITFQHISKLAKIYVQFRDLTATFRQEKKQQRKLQKQSNLNQHQQQQRKLVSLIYHSIRRIHNNKFSLPMFTSDWNLSVRSTQRGFQEQIKGILTHQNNPKFTNAMRNNQYQAFKSEYNKINSKNTQNTNNEKPDPTEKNTLDQINQLKNKDFISAHNSIKKISTKSQNLQFIKKERQRLELIQSMAKAIGYNPYDKGNKEVHLVLEGVNHSNQCIGAYYYIVKNIVEGKQPQEKSQEKKEKNVKSKQDQHIKAITCSNFHSIFGFLLVLGKDPETIRKEMYKLKHLAATMEHQKNINQYFEQRQYFNNTPNKYAKILKYLEQQTEGIFEQLQKKSKLKFADNSLKKQFSEMRLIFEHQKQSLMSMYEKILDQTCEQIKFIDGKYMQEEKGNEVAKKYAFNYNCQYGLHSYSTVSQQSIKKFNEIVGMIYKSFGDLVSGIVANALSNSSLLLLNQTNAQLFVKGVVAQRLFTTYKLKDYIIRQLKKEKISPNITLSEFYSVKRTIFLNFTVININEQRLDFLNKETMPNMPVWAAIIASSSMPFFHKFFQGSKEWDSPSSENFYGYIIEDFFKTYQSKKRITNYLSGNYISSLPLQLLTNSAVTKIMFADEKIRYLKFFGLAFNQTYKNPISDMKIAKNYLSTAWTDKFKLLGGVLVGKLKKFKKNKFFTFFSYPVLTALGYCNHKSHQNNAYKIQYPIGQYISSYLGSGSLMKTKDTLSESNDNFILKWYYNKLIRLPIKINTLDFHQIVDQNVRNTYNINLPSVKAQQTIERSYEITKSFIDQLKPTEVDKYKAIFRAQIMSIHYQISGFDRQYIKVSFLNHSKWNQNKYNNFVVEYATVVHGIQPRFKRAAQSQILWLVEESSTLKLRFYYPQIDQQDVKQSKIRFTEFQLDFSELVNRPFLFNKDSFDYQLMFAGDKVRAQLQLQQGKDTLRANKMNKIDINWKQPVLQTCQSVENIEVQNQQVIRKLAKMPCLKCKIVQENDHFFGNYYIQPTELPKQESQSDNKP